MLHNAGVRASCNRGPKLSKVINKFYERDFESVISILEIKSFLLLLL